MIDMQLQYVQKHFFDSSDRQEQLGAVGTLAFRSAGRQIERATPVSAVPGPPSCSQDGIVSWWCRETRWFEMSYVVKLNKAAW